MKIAGTVILYHSGKYLLKNIQSYLDSIDKLYIIDNTETPLPKIKAQCSNLKNTVYFHDGENKGIAARLNQVSEMAINEGYDWLLTMDQDSSFQKESCSEYLNCFSIFEKKHNVSMFGVSFLEQLAEPTSCNAVSVHDLITSGSLVNLSLIKTIGYFDENLFIDEVDFEYCLRSVHKGFRIIQFTNIFLNHNLGNISYHRSYKTNQLSSRTLHSPVRLYYMTRNFLYVQSKYRNFFTRDFDIKRKSLLNRFKNNILYNKQRFSVIKNILKGFRDYRNNQMGRLQYKPADKKNTFV